jgi:putative Mg2+ transporter-C (MgtC) family protein
MNYITFIIRIFISFILGLIIGYEREKQNKNAGLRDNILICISACAITLFTIEFGELTKNIHSFDYIRAISYFLVAIGFVGGNITSKHKDKIEGITTATLLIPVSIIGFYCGIGSLLNALLLTIVIYGTLKLKYLKFRKTQCRK